MIANSILGVFALGTLAFINSRLAGSLHYPPALFAGWWALLLLALACSGEAFYPISAATLEIYLLGPCAMSFGGLIAIFLYNRAGSRPVLLYQWKLRQRLLTVSVGLLVVAFPGLWYRISEISAASGVRDFWVGVRLQTMGDSAAGALGIFEHVSLFSTVVALVAFEDFKRRGVGRVRAALGIALGLAYHLVTASRLGSLMLIGGVVGISILHGRRTLKPLMAGALAVLPVFVTVALALNKGTERGGDIGANAVSLARSFQLYALGGVVAFQSAVEGTITPEGPGRTYRVAYVAARAAGYDVDIPNLVSQYTYTPTPTNVYTLYYPYFLDFGKAGVVVMLGFLGWLFGWVYLAAKRAAGPFTAAYGLIFSYIALSSADEYVFTLISMNLQVALCLMLLYQRVPHERFALCPALSMS